MYPYRDGCEMNVDDSLAQLTAQQSHGHGCLPWGRLIAVALRPPDDRFNPLPSVVYSNGRLPAGAKNGLLVQGSWSCAIHVGGHYCHANYLCHVGFAHKSLLPPLAFS